MAPPRNDSNPPDAHAALPYRDCVAAVILDGHGNVLAGRKHTAWHLPQGGVTQGETPEQALTRELAEELGTDKFIILSSSPTWRTYDWPWPMRKGGTLYRGQRQRYYLAMFDGTAADLDPHRHGEFSELAWMTPAELLERAWEVKRPVYEQVFKEFGLCRP